MTLHTPLCDRLGIRVPIVGAGMAGSAGPELAAAVSEAGGLGSIGGATGRGSVDRLRAHLALCRSLTSAPFAVNFIAHALPDPPSALDVCVEAGVPVVTLSFTDPSPYVARLHDAGVTVMHQAQTMRDAERALAAGVDVLIAQGGEAGGHTGQIGTLAFVPQVVAIAGQTPVLAAGGIATGRGLAAALALGAQGAVLGTALLAAEEVRQPWPLHRERLLAAGADDTVWTAVHDIAIDMAWPDGVQGRTVRTPFNERWHGREDALRRGRAGAIGEPGPGDDRDPTPAYAGQIVGLVHEVRPAARIVEGIVAEAEAVLRALGSSIDVDVDADTGTGTDADAEPSAR